MKLLQRRCDTMALTSRVRIAVCLALWQHPCPLRLLRRHLSQSERLWHSVTFSGKHKSVSSKTKPLCQGLSCQESCRADARLRGWTKDAFRVSGITQVLLCTTSPSSSLRSMPAPLVGEALAFRKVCCYRQRLLKVFAERVFHYSSSRRFLMIRVIAPPATTASIRM